ncbi:hypothetical protein Tco_0290178 [Tanacetum coccineum]
MFFPLERKRHRLQLLRQKLKLASILKAQDKIQCLTPRSKFRVEGSKYSGSNPEEEVTDKDYDDAGSRSLGSEASPNLSAKSTSSQDMPPTSLLGRIKIMFKLKYLTRITHDEQEQEYSDSPSPVPQTTSIINATSSKNLLEAAEDTIGELRDESKLWERIPQKLMLDLEILKENSLISLKVLQILKWNFRLHNRNVMA